MDEKTMCVYVIGIFILLAIAIAVFGGEIEGRKILRKQQAEPTQVASQDPPSEPIVLTVADRQWLSELVKNFGEEGQLL